MLLLIDRAIVSHSARFTTFAKGSFWPARPCTFSRMRSKMTTESLIEKPRMVNSAAT